jgi:hypothetical protein
MVPDLSMADDGAITKKVIEGEQTRRGSIVPFR